MGSIPDDDDDDALASERASGVPEAGRGEHETLAPQAATGPPRARGGEGGKGGRGRAVSRGN